MHIRHFFLIVLGLFALGIAACGDNTQTTSADTAATETASAETATPDESDVQETTDTEDQTEAFYAFLEEMFEENAQDYPEFLTEFQRIIESESLEA